MNKARIFPKEDNISIMNQLHCIRCGALKNDKAFKEDNYKWCLGVDVINDIDIATNTINNLPIEKRILFGIVVEVDYQHPCRMELWKNITNDV